MPRSIVALVLGLTLSSPAALAGEVLQAKQVAAPPSVDGTAEALWDAVPGTMVKLAPVPAALVAINREKQSGKYAKNWGKDNYTSVAEVELKAVYTANEVFFLARWKDASKDDQHKPFKWEGDKKAGEYVNGEEREDRLAFQFPIHGEFSANMLSATERVVDVWQWKAARTNGAGLLHDKHHVYAKSEPKGKFSTHYTADGTPIYIVRANDGGVSPYKTNKVDPFTYQGDLVAQYLPIVPEQADAADVRARGRWQDGQWTVEAGRKLDTGHADTDAVFAPPRATKLAVAAFDHAGDHFHAVSGVVELTFE
ncbi:MAG: ethylbenzene dehydrogenase-related protein [Deferrisomatales bacterium]|nr:ethylbenzene dehydrogenase-related protein [Deferrisomatales bacterium]